MRSHLRLPAGLPPLRGLAWWPFMAVWLAVLGFAIYGNILAVSERSFQPTPLMRYGFSADAYARVIGTFGHEADASGIHAGDRIVAVDGRPVGDRPLALRKLLINRGLPPVVALSVRSASGAVGIYRLTNSPQHIREGSARVGFGYVTQQLITLAIIVFSMLIVPVALATLLLLRRTHDPLAPWVSMTTMLVALGFGAPLDSSAAGGDGALGWALEIAVPLAGWMLVAVLALFPDARFRPRATWLVVFGALPLAYWQRVGSSALAVNIASLVGQLAAVAVVWARYRAMPPGIGRQQIRWALFGFAASLVALVLLIVGQTFFGESPDLVIRVYGGIVDTILNGLANVLLLAAMTLGLMRYRLYDADATISRSVAYGALTLGALAVFAGSEKLIEALGEEYFGERLGALAGGIGAAMAAVLLVPMHHRVTRWAEHRFRGGLARLRHGLPLLVNDMRATATPAALADAMLTRVETGVRARHGAVVLRGEIIDVNDIDPALVREWLNGAALATARIDRLDIDRDDALFPLRVPLHADGPGLVGWLLLGPRPDGSFYGREEREVLLEIAEPVARALAVANERQQRDAERDAEISSLRKLLGRVVAHLGLDGGKRTAVSRS